jgi:peptide/nickel transport system substrate-binding protein
MGERSRWCLALLLALALLGAACGSDDDTDDDTAGGDGDEAATEAGTDEEPAATGEAGGDGDEAATAPGGPSGTLKIANNIVTNTLNPHDDQTPATFSFYAWTFESLVRQNPDATFSPHLAEGWEVSDDGLTITFTLREGVTFHDGTPFDAAAVKASLDYVKTGPPEQVIPPVAGQLANVTEVEVLGDHELALHLAQPGEVEVIAWLSRNSGLIVSPDALGSAATNPIGTGPYVYNAEESSADLTHLVFDANPEYWQADAVGFERVEIDNIVDNAARKQAFEAGQYDMATLSLQEGDPTRGRVESGPSVIFSFTVVDWQGSAVPQLASRDVRCAMAQALNREGIVSQSKFPAEAVRYQWAGGPGDYAWIDGLDVAGFDIDAAKAAFEATGEQPFTFTNQYLPSTGFETGSVAWAGGLNELGITMDHSPLDPPSGGEMFTAFAQARHAIQVIPINEPHPLMTLQQRATADGTLNPSGTVPDGVEELVEAAMLKSSEDAEADVAAAWKIMLEECIWIPFYNLYDGYWVADDIAGVEKVTGMPIVFWPQGVHRS